ncbi:alpha/beta hydrolase [Acidisoma cladoniae]|uniref:alpha/beta hydrolase n=1 Tax=Acidisoma cladoniae TaxID=3040935 RepID=UPI00254A0BB0|nr:alpha/beta hydrolase [Acidisoma sp. PAMC 29798]
MVSLRARLFVWFLKRTMKRRHGSDFDIAAMRAGAGGRVVKVPDCLVVTPGDVGGIAGEWVEQRRGQPAATLLYLHGGGYFFCSPRTHRPITLGFARRGFRVFAPAYRLAPEHPFPAAVEDAVAVYRGLIAQGMPAQSITVAGDSAGGGLVMAMLLSLRDAGDALPAAAVLFSPWTDLAATGASLTRNSHSDAMFYGDQIAEGGAIYLAGADPRSPLASPLYAALHGLPPLLIHASDDEVLLDDSTRLAARVHAAGGRATLRTWRGVPHAWPIFSFLPEARQSMDAAAAFLQAAFLQTG